ncbi:MAG: carboxymuconolactone decarboxylase family protein [Rhodospirillales bacterium]|nr:carboxymuconolactone decarboxylase family protein [Rhodospirillales bacterium]
MSRLPPLPAPDQLSPAQRLAFDAIAAGPRKRVSPAYQALLWAPDLADRIQKLGEHTRFGGPFSERLRELSILVTARAWNAAYEWYAHAPLAAKAGLDRDIMAAIAARRVPTFKDADEALIYEISTDIHTNRQLSEPGFRKAVARWGEEGAVELIALNAYYAMFAMLLLGMGVEPPADSPPFTLPA